ncbi:MAG: Trm112 family protein [Actinobacteria bacterium]|nr:Trm112 family protein [Actinomycetota bacterium]
MAGPLGLSENLWEVLACPCDAHDAVVADEQDQMIVCTVCQRRFPVRDGVPVMLLDEALFPPAVEG